MPADVDQRVDEGERRCDLQKADFREASDYAIDPSANQMQGARFSFPDVVALLNGFGLKIE